MENRDEQDRHNQRHQQQEWQQRQHPDGGNRSHHPGQQQPDPLGRLTTGQLLHALRTEQP